MRDLVKVPLVFFFVFFSFVYFSNLSFCQIEFLVLVLLRLFLSPLYQREIIKDGPEEAILKGVGPPGLSPLSQALEPRGRLHAKGFASRRLVM